MSTLALNMGIDPRIGPGYIEKAYPNVKWLDNTNVILGWNSENLTPSYVHSDQLMHFLCRCSQSFKCLPRWSPQGRSTLCDTVSNWVPSSGRLWMCPSTMLKTPLMPPYWNAEGGPLVALLKINPMVTARYINAVPFLFFFFPLTISEHFFLWRHLMSAFLK